ncbi:transposase [Streptomyces monashensis]|uniref:transposase n=1 Tax=Streptomyces monashensis TaxID=1678012 RepID=UPI0033CBF383
MSRIRPQCRSETDWVDEVVERLTDSASASGAALLGEGGLLTEITTAVLERALESEMTEHLGYEKHDPAGRGSGNSRNGTSPKTVLTDVGEVTVAVPRDRNGDFEPQLVPKYARRLAGFNACVIHLIRASLRLSSAKDHPKLVTALRGICTAPTEQVADQALDAFAASELGERYPAVTRTWRAAWPEFTPYLAFPPAIRTVVYSTNMVESINARLRKATRNRGHFPSEQAALKVLYLAVREQITPKARDVNHVAAHWKEALNQISLFFEDRLSIQ